MGVNRIVLISWCNQVSTVPEVPKKEIPTANRRFDFYYHLLQKPELRPTSVFWTLVLVMISANRWNHDSWVQAEKANK